MERNRLSLGTRLGYGAGEFSSSIFWITVAFWLMNYLTDELRLPAGLAGLALMIGKVWDAVTDPAVGYLSDRTRSRWGRRRPWFLYGALPFGLAFCIMFVNPHLEGTVALFLWAAGAFMLLCTAYTCANVPYNALLPELTQDYDERTTLTGYKSLFAVLATLVGAGAAMPIIGAFPSRTAGFAAMGAIFGLLIVLSVLVPFFSLREPVRAQREAPRDFIRSNRAALKNRPFLLILAAWTVNTIGMTVVTATLVYYFKYQFNDAALITPASIILLVTSMACIPLAVKVSGRLGKRAAYIAGMSIVSVSCLAVFLAGHLVGIYGIFGLMFLTGIGLSTHYVIPWAIVPDTIEYDYAESGVRREGTYYALWTFMIKVGGAMAGLFVGVVLSLFGYVPDVPQTATSLLGIRLLLGPITATLFIIGCIFLYFYPITRERYGEIQKRIAAMEAVERK
ncbi:MAG: MFS transporter [Spirochaetes bacterium]|nr:MFS transporter [Spirochaetota bacterium]